MILSGQIILFARGQLLDAHLDAGFAGNAGYHVSRGFANCDAHGCRKTKSHRSQPARIDPAARKVKFVKLRSPHLMLAHVRGNERIPFVTS